jgi:alkylation response protein AidB-like acyl-CoA dehydrogenase/flavin-dependent dehydrogenase/ferredoxin-like protein FixX
MNASTYEVVIVGGGAAGLTAAIGLARAGFAVAVVEAAPFPGAENWSGCVYFCENLAHPDILGPEGVEELAWERRLIERGFFATDGHGLLGMTYRAPDAFRHCYTVLRPIYDHHLAQVARRQGVASLDSTTAESLIRDDRRVVGVCTQRGPLYADLVFLAEGDASHLVTREGYERYPDQREAPKFLQGLKQVIEMAPGAIEEIFGVGPEEGVAYEMLLRNGTLNGRSVHLNMGGFLYTNRQSLSVGLVLPADNLAERFAGDPNLLMQWFEHLPALRPWLREGRPGVFGAKIIRGGGARDIPTLIDEGLAIGGAASAIGIDFPYPNFTGPATAMGLLLVQAARRIRDERTGFTREALRRHYLEPLQRTHYWRDVEFLRRWPGYVKRTEVFFGGNIDLALGTAYVWTRPRRWFLTKWTNWLRLVGQVAGPAQWRDMRHDWRHLGRALRLRDIAPRPALGRLLLDGTINALRDLFGRPRANLPQAGALRLHYSVAGGTEPAGLAPRPLRRWFRRFQPVLAAAAHRVYSNNDVALQDKLPSVTGLLVRQVNAVDLLAFGILGWATVVSTAVMSGWDRLRQRFRRNRPKHPPRWLFRRYAGAARRAGDLTPLAAPAAQNWEPRLGGLAYRTVNASHIHVLWPNSLADKDGVVKQGLWHVCPAHVYEARISPLGQLQVIVNFENCIKCETCWRTSELVDWARDGRQRLIYAVHSPVMPRLLDAIQSAGSIRAVPPRTLNWWEPAVNALAEQVRGGYGGPLNGQNGTRIAECRRLLARLDHKLKEFDDALAEEPRTVDRARAEYLEMLTRYAQQLAEQLQALLREHLRVDDLPPAIAGAFGRVRDLMVAVVTMAQERSRRTWNQRYAWAAADGRQLRWHHLNGLRRLLDLLAKHGGGSCPPPDPLQPWLRAEADAATVAGKLAAWSARLDAVLPAAAWRDLERQVPLSSEADAVVRDLVAQVPLLDPLDLPNTLHPPLRKALLAELARRDPSLAYRAASHLWARDLVRLAAGSAAWMQIAERIARVEGWACFAMPDVVHAHDGGWKGEALFVPATAADTVLLLLPNQLLIAPAGTPGLHIEPLATLGLRGAGLARVRLEGLVVPEARSTVDHDRVCRVWNILSAADLTSMAFGMADQLCRRAVGHATNRVQFPGLFHDEESRDPIGKFGAVKKMIAEMGARRYLIETLDHTLSPADFSAAAWGQAGLIKALVAEALGTAPGSLSYNAGQVFGGTGYSEDDTLAKFYRDAAAWRFLGVPNSEMYRRHGYDLLRNWRTEGQRLAGVRDETELFEQVTQRKALQAELDEVRNARSRIRGAVFEWQSQGHTPEELGPGASEENADAALPQPSRSAPLRDEESDPTALAEICEELARQEAHLLASKTLVLRTHGRLEEGFASEVEITLTRVWLENAAVALEEFEGTVHCWLDLLGRHDGRPVVEPSAGPAVTHYADYLASSCPYDSGDFLVAPIDLLQARFVPEMLATDPELARRNQEIRDLMADHFGRHRGEGLSYERYIERQHRADGADLDFLRQHGFLRMMIPKDLGGEDRQKVDYYMVTTNAQRLADVAISLTIQVNTSIGTTPVLLARDKDLPKAKRELGAFVADAALQREIGGGLEELRKLATYAEPYRVMRALERLRERLGAAVFNRSVVKSLASRYEKAWQEACKLGGQEFEPAALEARLAEAAQEWKDVCLRAGEMLEELERRREACDLFLRWVASGQISAFALTEPSAGSDTARVATRASLRSVPVEVDPDGVFPFVPFEGNGPRYLLDARRLEFSSGKACYRWSETMEPAAIRFDEYDYETDDPSRMRFYDHGDRRVHFTDIAQLRERDGKLWYDYWELTGAKMWITNGRMAGIMCLYAKTEDGRVTGFIVDRHAEGLIVGKDEDKLGQCGSPTNELALQAVRVPRENVIGIEGRGQVNALETLNVGRAGLAMSAMAQMEALSEWSRAFARETHGEVPDWAEWRLRRMEEARFTAEALAHEVVGRFEHPQTKSVRLESAISKMLVTELLHQVIELAEDIHGLAGQTQLHLVEKRKRDARVLNIYEGTNEIQRFFILKDLAGEVAPRWSQTAPKPTAHLGREALELEALKGTLRQRLQAALSGFGQGLWQNPNLQANCFLLAEAAAWLKGADSTLGRLAWLSRSSQADEAADPSPKMELARRALARCFFEIRRRLQRFDEELAHLRRGYYAPEVRAASLLFDRTVEAQPAPRLSSRLTRSLSVLIVLDPLTAEVPQPYVAAGRLLEPYLSWTEADRAALESALRIRDEAAAPVSIQVAAVGSRGTVPVLREAFHRGADRVRLVVPETEAVTPDSAAAALAAVLGEDGSFDLVLGGAGEKSSEDGLVSRLTAAALGVPYAGVAAQIAVQATAADAALLLAGPEGRRHVRSLPAAVSIAAGVPLRQFTVAGYLAGLAKNVEILRWPRKARLRPERFLEGFHTGARSAAEELPRALSPQQAACHVLEEMGLTNTAVALKPFDAPIEEVTHPSLLEPNQAGVETVIAVVAAGTDGRLKTTAKPALDAARAVAACRGAVVKVLLVASRDEDAQRFALAQVGASFLGDTVVAAVPLPADSHDVKARLLAECWPELAVPPRLVVGEPWTEGAFAALACRPGQESFLALRVRRVELQNGTLVLQTVRGGGKLPVSQTLDLGADGRYWMSLTGDAEISGCVVDPTARSRVQRWNPRLERFYGQSDVRELLEELQQVAGVVRLPDADFIVDVGFGVGNRDGFEAVIDPLVKTLQELGVRNLVVGGSRKVTEELRLLPTDRQIGQSGVSVNPQVLLAIGISGAPQHLNYIGPRAVILAFNRDPEAPIMTLNQRQPRPRVFPVLGDLFQTVPALTAALRDEFLGQVEPSLEGMREPSRLS